MVDPNDSLYVAGSDGVMRVLDLANGHEKWALATGVDGSLTGVALSGNARTVFFADKAGTLYAVDIATHKEIWRTSLPGIPTTPPIVTPDETVYIGVGRSFRDAGVVAANRQGVKWRVPTPAGTVEYLAVGEDGTVYAAAGSDLFAIK
jgi:outer membrane protein assembly factor BamB